EIVRFLRYLRLVGGPGVKVDLTGSRVSISADPAVIIIAACMLVAFESKFATRKAARQPISDLVE
ncbi:MAG: hypothetical protein AAGI11_23225, partial [Pseudomonadota bacterium]